MSPAFALCLWTMIVALGLISALGSVDRLRSRGASRDILIAARGHGPTLGLRHAPRARLLVWGKTPEPLERSDRPPPGRLPGLLNLGVFPHPTPRRAMRG